MENPIFKAIEEAHIDPLPWVAEMVDAYITAALWSSSVEPDKDRSFLDAGYTVKDLGHSELRAAIIDCLAFRQVAGGLLDAWSPEQAGHDLWLTRCGHGAGFWNRGFLGRDELAAMCGHGTLFPNRDIYLGDDGRIYGFV